MGEEWAKNFKNGCKFGSHFAANEVRRAFTGIILEPKNGFKNKGMKGGAIGFGKGLAGFFGRPLRGGFNFIAQPIVGLGT